MQIVQHDLSIVWRDGRSFLESLCVLESVSLMIGRVLGTRNGFLHCWMGLCNFGGMNR